MGKVTKVVVAGEGGQGVQVIGEILALAAYMDGKESVYIPNFGVEQRGGVSIAFVQLGDEPIGAPKFKYAHIVAALSERAIERTRGYVTSDTILIYDSSSIEAPTVRDEAVGIQSWDTIAPEAFANMTGESLDVPAGITTEGGKVIRIPAAEIAKKEFHPRVFNILMLGVIAGMLEIIESDAIERALNAKLGHKFREKPELKDLNLSALSKGREMAMECKGVASV